MAVNVQDFGSRELWEIYSAIIASYPSGTAITEPELYEVFNGDFAPGGAKIKSLFEQKSGLQRSVADMLMNKNNVIIADVLTTTVSGTTIADVLNQVNEQAAYKNAGDYKNAVLSAKALVKEGRCALTGLNVYNPNNVTVFIKFYDAASTAAVTVGVTSVAYMLPIPPFGSVVLESTNTPKKTFGLGIVAVALTGYLDSDVTAPATALYVSNINFNNNTVI